MNTAIWKYELENTDMQTLEIPAGAEILCIQPQNHTPCIWAVVNPEAEKIKRVFEVYGTGHPIPPAKRTYIGSYQLLNGQLVFHCFELEKVF